jgi:transposase-like protein
MKRKTIIRYSEAFKMEVVKHYESSGLTMGETSKMYGITGCETVRSWLRKYGKSSSLNKVIRVEKPDESNRLKKLEKEVKQLKEALADTYLRKVTAESTLEVAAEMMGLTVDELKKKLGEK